jgi:hypothetical protein
MEDAKVAFEKIETLKASGKFNPKAMANIMKKCRDQEEIYVTPCVKKALVRLEMIDLSEFHKDGNLQYSSIKPSHICSSLKSWLVDKSERVQFYTILRVVEQLHQNRQLPQVKTLINEKFIPKERGEMIAMLNAIVKKNKKK